MKPCCGVVPTFWKDGKWSCSECDGEVVYKNSDQTVFTDLFDDLPPLTSAKKCECGADSVYGPNNSAHSATMPCPLYRK